MKSLSLILVVFIASQAFAQQNVLIADQVIDHHKHENVYEYANFFIAGQPELETLEWFKEKGVVTIINLRTKEEMSEFAEENFDEEIKLKELSFKYCKVPVSGYDDYTPRNLKRLSRLISTDEKTVIHCRSGGRATQFFMAYLVKYQDYSVEEASQVGKQMRFVIPLEYLLDTEIRLEVDSDVVN